MPPHFLTLFKDKWWGYCKDNELNYTSMRQECKTHQWTLHKGLAINTGSIKALRSEIFVKKLWRQYAE